MINVTIKNEFSPLMQLYITYILKPHVNSKATRLWKAACLNPQFSL